MSYCVIGGQYEPVYYGERKTLHAAKLLATRNAEYWDNWQGWHTPPIYRKEDTCEVETHGWVIYPDGIRVRIPNGDPYLVKGKHGWEEWR